MEPVLVTGAGTWNPVNLQRGIQREEEREREMEGEKRERERPSIRLFLHSHHRINSSFTRASAERSILCLWITALQVVKI